MGELSISYGDVLVVAIVAAGALRDRGLLVCATVLWANLWLLSQLYHITGSQFDWTANATADYGSALIVAMCAGRTRVGQILIVSFAVELVWHLMYAAGPHDQRADWNYWHQMSWTAWGQAMVVLLGEAQQGGGKRYSSLGDWLNRLCRSLGARALRGARSALSQARR